jgi:hypothetical protein
MNTTQHLASPGLLCQQYQRSYHYILRALSAADVKPIFTLDLVPYFDWHEASRALEANPLMIRGRGNGSQP